MAEWDKKRIVAIGGPTASGKTSFSVALARQFGGEVICADSMQIYDGLDVGTAKVTPEEMQGVPHHLVGFLSPEQPYSVAEFVADAGRCINEITGRAKVPFVVGGTGLYIESLVSGLRFSPQKPNPQLRRQLEEKAQREGPEAMHQELLGIDPEYAAKVHPNNTGRVIRALELYYDTGVTMTRQRAASLPKEPPYEALVLCLDWPREVLYSRIDRRVGEMLDQGLLQEAELVWKNKERYKTAAQAIGYKEFFPYFEGDATVPQCAAQLRQASRNYAKRQLTWFRRMPGVVWVRADEPDALETAAKAVKAHLEGPEGAVGAL